MIWHLDDLVSDFSAIHRISDITAMPGPGFFRAAWRLAAYQGVIAARAHEAREGQPDSSPSSTPVAARRDRVEVPATKAAIGLDPVLSKVISFA